MTRTNGVHWGSNTGINNNHYAEQKMAIKIDVGKEPNENGILLKRRIKKVPPVLRNNENNKGEYDPKVVSLGPYHHGKPELQLVESLKPMVARLFVSDSNKDMEEFYEKVLLMVDDMRSCYDEGSTITYSNDEFAKMMLLDGCFVLGMIESFDSSDHKPNRRAKYDDVMTHLGVLVWYSINSDMVFLLENQLPFQVLELLMSLKYKDDEGMKRIDAFLEVQIPWDLPFQIKKETKGSGCENQPLHILQLFWKKLLLDQYADEVNQPLPHLNSLRSSQRVKHKNGWGKVNPKDYIHSFRSVTELKAKGIHFRPIDPKSRKAIKFKSFWFSGLLELPPFLVTPKTKIMLSNIIAYEMWSDNTNSLAITSYVGFLKSLIDHPNDVKELRSKHVLFNRLGSDEEVANVFKEISTFAAEDYGIYGDVTQSIEEHYKSMVKTWMAEFFHQHFSSPWTVVASIAASFMVVSSFLQSYFTMFPRSTN